MARPIWLFVSSSPELTAEREAVGQAVAELPVSLGWEIKHTPRRGEDIREPLAFAERCDLYLVVLGTDFAAPMGLEWGRALDAGRAMLTYCKRVLHSPSAQALLRQPHVAWTEFQSPQELKALVAQALAHTLLDRGEQFGLHVEDVEGLLALVKVGIEEEEGPVEPDQRQGAGRGGVIVERRLQQET